MNQPHPLHPLSDFYRLGNRPLPVHRILDDAAVPEPQRSLLVHEKDMTSTLESFHGSSIHLELLSCEIRGNLLLRQVVLRLDNSDSVVEFGATRVALDRFEEPWRSQIVASHRPLGGILNASRQPYLSRPSAFLEIQSDEFLERALQLRQPATLFGRRNALRTPEGQVIAEILEILPPTR